VSSVSSDVEAIEETIVIDRVGCEKSETLLRWWMRALARSAPLFFSIAIVLMRAVPSGAQAPPEDIPKTHAEQAYETAPVTLDGETLFRVRGVTAFPAEVRAKGISERVRALAADPTFDPRTLRIVEEQDRSIIYAGEAMVAVVADADARFEGVERSLVAQFSLTKIAEAVEAYRRDREPRVLLKSASQAGLATALFVAFVLGLVWVFRRSDAAVERRIKAKLQDLESVSRRLIQAEQLWRALRAGLRMIRIIVFLVAAYLYLSFVLSLFPWTRPFATRVFSLLLDPLSEMGRAVIASGPGLVFLAVLVVLTRWLLRSIRLFFLSVEQGKVAISGFEPEWAVPTYKIIRLFTVAFAVVMAYPYIPGSSSAAFKGVSLFLGVLISIGSSSFIANVIAGYTMTYRRTFRLGDRIQIEDYLGDVMEIRNLVTHLRTPKNEEIVVPNSLILSSHVINYSALAKKPGLMLHTVVEIGYETPWRQVEAMLLIAAERTQGLVREPAPFVLVKELGKFGVTYELNVYCDDATAMPRLYSSLHQNVLDVFNEYGIQLMTPAYEGDPQQAKIVPEAQWYASPAKGPKNP